MKKIVKLLIFVLTFLVFISVCNAMPETFNRNEIDNYGVNKKWEITNKNKSNVLRTPLVDAKDKVYDFADILDDKDEKKMYYLIEEFTETTGMGMVFLTINMRYSYDSLNEDYAADFYDYNDFGIDIEHYSGVLLLRNAYEADPYFNIYTFGDAQLYFTYERLEYVLDDIYDYFHAGNYRIGFETFVKDMKEFYKKGKPNKHRFSKIDDNGDIIQGYVFHPIIMIIVSGIFTAVYIGILVGKNKMIRKAYTASDYLVKDSIVYTTKTDMFIGTHTTSYVISSSSGGSSGGHISHGSSGGGHSSGGGRHG